MALNISSSAHRRRYSRRPISQRGNLCERYSLWPVGSPRRESSPRSPSPRRLRMAMCLQSMTSLPPNCTVSRSRRVRFSFHKVGPFVKHSFCTVETFYSAIYGSVSSALTFLTDWLPCVSPCLLFCFCFVRTSQWLLSRANQTQRGRRRGRKWMTTGNTRSKPPSFVSWSLERRCNIMF